MLGLIPRFALTHPLRRFCRVQRGGHANHDVGREQLAPVVGLDRDAVFDLAPADLIHDRVHLEGQIHVFRGPVPHQLELAVGGHEADDAIVLELPQLHALVELAILQRDAPRRRFRRFRSRRVAHRGASLGQARGVQQQAVVEPEFAIGHPREVGAHDDLPGHVGAEDGATGGHEEVDVLDDVDEGFVLAVADVGFPPGEGAGGLHGDAGGVLEGAGARRVDAFGGDVHFKRVGFGVLGVAEVDDFCVMGGWLAVGLLSLHPSRLHV